MKLSFIIVPIVCLAGCSAPQAPPLVKGTTIPGLNIPDTIDFGVVRAGVGKDTNIVFRNAGSDTIQIVSQHFSDSEFKLANTSKNILRISPDSSQTVQIHFLPTDTTAVLSYDTIRTANRTNIIVLRGNGIPFVSLAVLSVPDTINFGIVQAGIAKDSNVAFKNTGIDTLKIISQGFSNSAFKLANASQSQLTIAPGTNQSVSIQYTPSDTSNTFGYDTIRTTYKTFILMLQGSAIPFSSSFLIAPKEITISLTGVIGRSYGSPFTFSFYYAEQYNPTQSHDSAYSFSGSNSGADYEQNGSGDELDWWSNTTSIAAAINMNLIIKLLSVEYDYSYDSRGNRDGNSSKNEVIKLRDLSMAKAGNSYTAIASGSAMRNIIDTIYINIGGDRGPDGPYCHDQLPPMDSLIGYTDSAKLTITIQ